MEKLSVVIPVYNTYKYLRQCLDSIVNQTYKNLEIIIVNDASPYKEDDEICIEYAEKDERIIYIKHDINKGQGGARNTGIKNATGKYITFVDSDDFLIQEDIYEFTINKFNKNKKIDVVGFNVYFYYDETNSYEEIPYMNVNLYYLKPSKMEIYKVTDIVWHKVYKTDSIKKYNLWFKENFLYEDTDFTIKYIALVNPTYQFLNKFGYGYRQRKSSVSHTKCSDKERIKSLCSIYRDIENIGKIKEYNNYFLGFIKRYYEDVERDTNVYFYELEYLTSKIFKNLQEDEVTLDIFSLFLKNEDVRKCYDKNILKYKPYKYKLVTPNIVIYKIKKEISLIIKKIKKIKNI